MANPVGVVCQCDSDHRADRLEYIRFQLKPFGPTTYEEACKNILRHVAPALVMG